jgi:hypothetical protein
MKSRYYLRMRRHILNRPAQRPNGRTWYRRTMTPAVRLASLRRADKRVLAWRRIMVPLGADPKDSAATDREVRTTK